MILSSLPDKAMGSHNNGSLRCFPNTHHASSFPFHSSPAPWAAFAKAIRLRRDIIEPLVRMGFPHQRLGGPSGHYNERNSAGPGLV